MAALFYEYADLTSIARAIERSPIRVAGLVPEAAMRPCEVRDLPTGYDVTDVIILDWIAAEVSRVRHRYPPF